MIRWALSLFVWFTVGCGVKGFPTPPERPPSLGRGQPTFKEAIKEVQPAKLEDKDKKKEKEREDK